MNRKREPLVLIFALAALALSACAQAAGEQRGTSREGAPAGEHVGGHTVER
jgi:hypothetical protein